jgi:hypothetical protein
MKNALELVIFLDTLAMRNIQLCKVTHAIHSKTFFSFEKKNYFNVKMIAIIYVKIVKDFKMEF